MPVDKFDQGSMVRSLDDGNVDVDDELVVCAADCPVEPGLCFG